ncbi:hypothetical protein [Streptomyces chryseus]
MKVRIEAQRALNGTVRCELVITGPHDAEVRLPARFTAPDDEGVIELLADGAPFEVEVDAPLLQSVSVDAGHVVDVRGAGEAGLDDEPDAHRDTLLGQQFAGLSEDSGDAVRREMDRREAAGLPAVPEMSWED